MMRRLSLRTRLTVFVTVVFAVAMSGLSYLMVELVEDDLVSDTRASAEAVLGGYLESVNGGVASLGVVDATTRTAFFYRDENGVELSENEYFQILAASFDTEFAAALAAQDPPLPFDETIVGAVGMVGPVRPDVTGPSLGLSTVGTLAEPLFGDVPSVVVHPDTGELIGPSGATITLVAGPLPTGEPRSVDLGDDVVGVAQVLQFFDGTSVEVGVSSPLQPVTDSLDALRRVLWMSVPVLVMAIAAITWLSATRALRPVHAISARTRAITADNIDQRVPIPAAQDEIRELATTVNGMLERLERSQHRQRQLVADASHELRSPVAASRTQLEVATADPEGTDWATTAATVLAEQEHLSIMIDDLLALSRLDEASVGSDSDVDLDDIVLTEARRHNGHRIEVVIPRPIRVTGDVGLLTRVVRNLVDNAVRHSVAEVRLTLELAGAVALLHVDDDGSGVPPADRSRVFDRFVRLDEARDRASGGAGLGLAIAREVARAHGGDVVCGDSPLGGARFTLSLQPS